MEIDKVILKNLLRNEEYTRKALPFLKDEYFMSEDDRVLYQTIRDFVLKYNTQPNTDAIILEVNSRNGLSEEVVKSVGKILADFSNDTEQTHIQWLTDATEKFCQEKGIYNAIMKSIDIMNNNNSTLTKGAIPQLLSDALAISFDPNVGHDYLEQYDDRFEYYHRVQEKIPFDLEYFNKITKDGLPKKTLNIALAGCVHPKTKVKIRFKKKL